MTYSIVLVSHEHQELFKFDYAKESTQSAPIFGYRKPSTEWSEALVAFVFHAGADGFCLMGPDDWAELSSPGGYLQITEEGWAAGILADPEPNDRAIGFGSYARQHAPRSFWLGTDKSIAHFTVGPSVDRDRCKGLFAFIAADGAAKFATMTDAQVAERRAAGCRVQVL
jgi:hypothetical protein